MVSFVCQQLLAISWIGNCNNLGQLVSLLLDRLPIWLANFSNASLTLSFAANESVKSELRKQKDRQWGSLSDAHTHRQTRDQSICIKRQTRLRTRVRWPSCNCCSDRDTERERERVKERNRKIRLVTSIQRDTLALSTQPRKLLCPNDKARALFISESYLPVKDSFNSQLCAIWPHSRTLRIGASVCARVCVCGRLLIRWWPDAANSDPNCEKRQRQQQRKLWQQQQLWQHTDTHTYSEAEATCARLADTTRLHDLRNLNNKKLSNKLLNKKSYLCMRHRLATPHRGNLVKKTWKITHINSSTLLLHYYIHMYMYICGICHCSHCVCDQNKSNENAQSGNIFRFLIRRKKLIFVVFISRSLVVA